MTTNANPSREELLRAPTQAPRDATEATATPLPVDPEAAKAAEDRTQRTLDAAQDQQAREAAATRAGAEREQAANRPLAKPPTDADMRAAMLRNVQPGRVVRFYSIREGECGPHVPDVGVPAIVTALQPGGRPNLTVFGDGIAPHPYANVPHFIEREADGVPVRWWVWPDQADEIAEGQRKARKDAADAAGRVFLSSRRDV